MFDITGVRRCVQVLGKIATDYVVLHVGIVLFPPSRSPVAKPHLKTFKGHTFQIPRTQVVSLILFVFVFFFFPRGDSETNRKRSIMQHRSDSYRRNKTHASVGTDDKNVNHPVSLHYMTYEHRCTLQLQTSRHINNVSV